ncbi:hypothetical protein L1Q77_02805, partial [Klebsiella pneumoniae]
CGKKIGPDPRNFNQRVSLGRNDLLIRTFPKTVASMRGYVNELTELALKEDINFIPVNSAFEAAQRIIKIAA